MSSPRQDNLSKSSISTFKEFSQFSSKIKDIEKLKSLGLSNNEVQLYFDFLRGIDYLQGVHKNMEQQTILNNVQAVIEKIKNQSVSTTSDSSQNHEQNKEYSIDPTFQLKKCKNETRFPPNHPMNHLNTLEENLFRHISNVDEMPSVNKRRKILRRMQRKLNKNTEPELPEPRALSHQPVPCSPSHRYDDFVTTNKQLYQHKDSGTCTVHSKNSNSKWDVEAVDRNVKPNPSPSKKQIIGCKPQTWYTIKDNTIVRLGSKPNMSSPSEKIQVEEVKIPINKAEEKILEGTRLTLDEIRAIPRFEHYQPGLASNVVYVKNLSKQIKEENLIKLFSQYDTNVKISILTGRMRGQAFATFRNVTNAVTAVNNISGTIVMGKPLILEYSKAKDNCK